MNRTSSHRRSAAEISALALTLCLAWAGESEAAGYAVKEQSGRLLGTAFAGAGSSAEDPSVLFYNPAGVGRLDGDRLSVSGSGIFTRSEFDGTGTLTPFGVPIPGGDGGDAGKDALVPAVYVTVAPLDFLHLGLGVNAPFGLSTEYEDDWVGRYHALESSLRTYDIQPVVAVKPVPWLSIGAGARFQYADAELTQAIDFGSVLAGLGVPGAAPFGADGKVELQASDWGFGYSVGALAEPIPGTRVGFAFRSKIDQDLNGNVDFEQVPAPLQAQAAFQDQHAVADVTTPESIDLSIYQEIGERWAVMADAQWTNWSRFDELRVDFDLEGAADAVTKESWHDSWFFALGTEYRPLDPLTLRAGFAYDDAPIRNEHRTARLPDQDRFWLALGASYAFTRWLSADLGYAHIFVREADIREEVATGPIVHRIDGSYDSAVDLVSLQLNLRY
jgi:long-chain fatty acid transport protein